MSTMKFLILGFCFSPLLVRFEVTHAISCIDPSNNFFSSLVHVNPAHLQPPELTEQQKQSYTNDFTCEYIEPSETIPTSAHALRPGDVKIVAALGDSLTAANGAGATTIYGVVNNYRGLSFSSGGYYDESPFNSNNNDNVKQHFSLPNALKFYNPSIKGWASGIAGPGEENAALDEAVAGSKAINLTQQAKNLIKDLQDDPEYDYDNDWKLVTVFIGGNNLCQICTDSRSTPDAYTADVQAALDILQENLPKTFVNLLTIFNINVVSALGKDQFVCSKAHECFCYCAMLDDAYSKITMQQYNGLYRDNIWELIQTRRYDTREDFTVVIQPFLQDVAPPFLEDGTPDLSYFAPDCFHFSKKGHNYAGEGLWNNMFQKTGSKKTYWVLGEELYCPTKEEPYIWTYFNSK
ncbi:phospholipase B1, membrane-associated-like [Symsagittifera roscoffensis]|uniref:phospholipase B1, membrane-associated-like n=1 Tax=Symsagittifera roscoffensis TaxID=84072 RepID=UPI00307C0177